MAATGDGIQKLLAAETAAGQIVAEARKAKQERLRQAKAEAEREIAAYRAEREGAYQKKLAEVTRARAGWVVGGWWARERERGLHMQRMKGRMGHFARAPCFLL